MSKPWSQHKFRCPNISHPMVKNVSKQSDDSIIQALLIRVRHGDVEACKEMVKEHMLLIKLKIQDFLSDYSYLIKEIDELVAIGLLACTEAIDRVKNGRMRDHNNITGYIRVAIWRNLGEWMSDYSLTARKQKPLPNSIDIFDTESSWIYGDTSTSNNINGCLATLDDHSCFEIKDTLESLDLVEKEWYIIESRMVGDTNEEIAKQLDVTEFTVRFILNDIYRRFLDLYRSNND